MASANIAGLWVARAAHRVSEFRTLAAVGADAARIFAILTTETILIAAAAAAGAIAVATVLTQLVAQMLWIGFLPLTMRLTPTVTQLLLVAASDLSCCRSRSSRRPPYTHCANRALSCAPPPLAVFTRGEMDCSPHRRQ